MNANNNERYLCVIPGIKMITKEPELQQIIEKLVKSGEMPAVISLLLHKMYSDPTVLSLSESPTELKLSKTISSLSDVATLMGGLKFQVEQSNELMSALNARISNLEEANSLQGSTLRSMVDLLSSSKEGLQIMQSFTERTGMGLEDIVQRTSTENDALFSSKNTMELQMYETAAAGDLGSEEDDDLLGSDMDDDVLLRAIQEFKSGS